MDINTQKKAPLYEALQKFRKQRVVPFDVPGHKRGRGNHELVELLGEKCVGLDVNSMKPLDNLCHPVSVILEAEQLAADAFGAGHAFFMVGGTTSAVQSMIWSVCKAGDKIILPRNVHKSVINALVLCGAVPAYVNPDVDKKIGIALGMELSQVENAIKENPDAVAILVNNPTYYGIASDLKAIVKLAHAHGMKVLADEAHGTHFYFGEDLPVSAMAAGADIAAVSMHKSGGSLTQSSLLLTNKNVRWEYVAQIINLTQTTSASYLLMSSLDISRRNLALRGRESFARVAKMAEYAIKSFAIQPRIAMLSYENFSANSETSKKVAKAVNILHQKYPDMIVDGEFQPDFAMSADHLQDYPFSKLGKTPANTFIFPNLESANLSYKIIRGMKVAQVVGPILLGLKQPVHVLQMRASVDEIVNLATIAVLDAQMREND